MDDSREFSVAVFCGATPSGPRASEHLALARNFGQMLAQAGLRCVNGGSGGMMTELSLGVREAGGAPHGVCLAQFPADESTHSSTELHPHLSPRQHALLLAGDAYVSLGGGYGTISEIMDVIARKTLHEIPMNRPMLCVGEDDHKELKRTLVDVHRRGFSRHNPFELVKFVATPDAAMDILLVARDAATK